MGAGCSFPGIWESSVRSSGGTSSLGRASIDTVQGNDEFLGRLEPVLRVAGQRRCTTASISVQSSGRRLRMDGDFVQELAHQFGQSTAMKGFARSAAERGSRPAEKQIRPRVGRPAEKSLRRHVVGRADGT